MTNVQAALFVCLIAYGAPRLAAGEPFPHVRTSEPVLLAALASGRERSPLFRELVDQLNRSDVVVHVVYDATSAHDVVGRLTFAVRAGGVRYLRVWIAPALRGCDLVAILGHELQHAVEIADAPSVVDQASMAAFYASIGARRAGPARDAFDTAIAVAVGYRVRREVLAPRITARDGSY